MTTLRTTTLSIGGAEVETSRWTETRNPATGEVEGRYCEAGPAEADAAAAAALAAMSEWGGLSAWRRRGAIRAIGTALRGRADEIARIISAEVGKPLAEARGEVAASAEAFEWAAEEACRPLDTALDGFVPANRVEVRHRPIGPVLALTPSNFPLNLSARKLSAALAAGCTVVLRPAEEAPATAAALLACCLEAGLPAGTVNLLLGSPKHTVAPLMEDDRIRAVSFTGSTQVGKLLIAASAATVKKVVLELGGHAPFLVLADADGEAAGRLGAAGKFRNAGQVCTSPTRFIVDGAQYDTFLGALLDGARRQVLGNGLDPEVTMGPLTTERQRNHVTSLVDDAVGRGARLLCGGSASMAANRGYFYPPTLLAEVPGDAAIRVKEPFGPVGIVDRVDGLDQALALANRSNAGLAGYVFGEDPLALNRVAEELEVGVLGVNSVALSALEAPFGGVKQSGYGVEGGRAGIEEFLVPRTLHRRVR